MTLIVGIKCSDGIVVGADGAATLGNVAGLRTVIQPVAKLHNIRNKAIVAVSGPVGVSQLYCDSVDKICNDWREDIDGQVCRRLRSEFFKDAEFALKVAALAIQVMGPTAQLGVVHHTLVALAARRKLHLIQFDYQCAPEMATDDLPFIAIGSGQIIADPFLAFLRSIFWKDHLPSISEGSFATMWTLAHAIRTAPGGISGPIQMATLRIKDGEGEAKELTEAELKDHREMIESAEDYLRQFSEVQKPTATEAEPPRSPTNS